MGIPQSFGPQQSKACTGKPWGAAEAALGGVKQCATCPRHSRHLQRTHCHQTALHTSSTFSSSTCTSSMSCGTHKPSRWRLTSVVKDFSATPGSVQLRRISRKCACTRCLTLTLTPRPIGSHLARDCWIKPTKAARHAVTDACRQLHSALLRRKSCLDLVSFDRLWPN